MTTEELLILCLRLLGALPVLRWPFWGGVAAVLVDQSDLLVMNLVDLGGVRNYQALDKYADQAYLLAFLSVSRHWPTGLRGVAPALYVFRLVGFGLFEVTGNRNLLLFFPNLFEAWFLGVAGVRQFGLQQRLSRLQVVALASLLIAVKLAQEYAIHYKRWLDGFTTIEALEAVWRWLTGPFS